MNLHNNLHEMGALLLFLPLPVRKLRHNVVFRGHELIHFSHVTQLINLLKM